MTNSTSPTRRPLSTGFRLVLGVILGVLLALGILALGLETLDPDGELGGYVTAALVALLTCPLVAGLGGRRARARHER